MLPVCINRIMIHPAGRSFEFSVQARPFHEQPTVRRALFSFAKLAPVVDTVYLYLTLSKLWKLIMTCIEAKINTYITYAMQSLHSTDEEELS